MEEIKSIEELQHLLKTRYEAVELLKAFHNEHNRLKWNEEDYIEFIEKIENILSDYEIRKDIKELGYIKEVLTKLDEENINLKDKYFITDNIYLSVFIWNRKLTFYFYIEDDGWLYENYISSHSGLNEWINDYINELYELYSGNSRYCYAFGTCSLKDYSRIIENENKDEYSSEKRYSVEQVVEKVKKLIEYFTDEKNEIRNAIIEDINARFDKLHKLVDGD